MWVWYRFQCPFTSESSFLWDKKKKKSICLSHYRKPEPCYKWSVLAIGLWKEALCASSMSRSISSLCEGSHTDPSALSLLLMTTFEDAYSRQWKSNMVETQIILGFLVVLSFLGNSPRPAMDFAGTRNKFLLSDQDFRVVCYY